MKRILKLTLALLLIFSVGVGAREIKITIDGKEVKTDVAPFIENSRTLVPVRFISETLGYKVDWNEGDRSVKITKDEKSIGLKIGSTEVTVEDKGKTTTETIDVAPSIKEDRTFVPVRFISETMGLNVGWDDETSTVKITTNPLATTLNGEEEKFVKEFVALQNELAAKTRDLRDVFFKNADGYTTESATAKLEEYVVEFDALVEKAKALNVPDKFKDAHSSFIDSIGILKDIVLKYKEAFLNGSKTAATEAITKLSDFSIKMTEVKDKLDAGISGIEYKAREEIKKYNEVKDANETKNLTNDPTIKNLLDAVSR